MGIPADRPDPPTGTNGPSSRYRVSMARRLPGIRARLEEAAIDLFATQGFAATTGRQIAEHAGTTERTFYRHFTDKADAAFGDETRLREQMAAALDSQPRDVPAWEVTQAGLRAVATLIEERPDTFVRRVEVVAANQQLRDRELARAPEWQSLIAAALARREVDEQTAELCAALALTLFRLAASRWAAGKEGSLLDALAGVERDAAAYLC
jgi:AcrR family transcriptional regulator